MAGEDFAREFKAIADALEALEALKPEQRTFAVQTIASRLGVALPAAPGRADSTPDWASAAGRGAAPPVPAAAALQISDPKKFLAAKRPTTDVERMVCLGFFLTHQRNTPHFESRDLVALNTEAAGRKFSNPRQTRNDATRDGGYFTSAGGRKAQITARGEAVVEALPDREAVKKALQDFPNRARPARGKKAKKK